MVGVSGLKATLHNLLQITAIPYPQLPVVAPVLRYPILGSVLSRRTISTHHPVRIRRLRQYPLKTVLSKKLNMNEREIGILLYQNGNMIQSNEKFRERQLHRMISHAKETSQLFVCDPAHTVRFHISTAKS